MIVSYTIAKVAVFAEGVFETDNPEWFLVDSMWSDQLKQLRSLVTLDQAKEMLRDDIIREYQEQCACGRRHGKNIEEINKKRHQVAEIRRLDIIAMIIMGFTKLEVQEDLGISRGTVNSVLHAIDPLELTVMYNKYRNSNFADVTPEALHLFIKSGCNYKEYRKALSALEKPVE